MPANNKEHFTKSIMFRTWIGFVFLTVTILALLWLMQVFFFKNYYQSMKRAQISRIGNNIVNNYGYRSEFDERFNQTIQDVVTTNQVAIAIFTLNNVDDCLDDYNKCQINVKLYSDITAYKPNEEVNNDFYIEDVEKFFQLAVKEKQDNFIYQVVSPKEKFFTLVYGASKVVNGEDVYFYMTSVLTPMDGTASILTNQLIIVTCICILMSLGLSFFISKRITSPITQFSMTAKKLGKGNYDVKFEGNGFTEIDELAKTLNYTTSEMAKTEQLRRDFLANVSHDLRTPLTMIKAYAEMIRDLSGEIKEKRDAHCKVIIDEADRLTALVNDILDLSKLQSNTLNMEMERLDLSSLTKYMYERFAYLIERDGYEIVLNVEDDCFVKGDKQKLEQVVYNLIANAVNYTGEDKKVIITLNRMWGKVKFSVTDSGKGIPQEEIDKVWDRYYRASQAKRGKVGSGIGLSIVKNVLVAHNAEYGIYSTVGKGSTFYFIMDYMEEERPFILPTDSSDIKKDAKKKFRTKKIPFHHNEQKDTEIDDKSDENQ